jgi:hypothetical protein
VLALGLSACAAAAIPLTAAEVGLGGFQAFKLVQTATGGSVGVSFRQDKDGKEIPPAALPPAKKVAIWPSDQVEMNLAEDLIHARQFEVVTPGKVRVILANAEISQNIKDLTDQEQLAAFSIVCRKTRSDLVLAARDEGSVTRGNSLSFSSAEKVSKDELMAFSCPRRAVVWRDQMTWKVELGDKTPSTTEISKVGGDAWGARIVAAETKPARQAPVAHAKPQDQIQVGELPAK